MRHTFLPLVLLVLPICAAQEATAPTTAAPEAKAPTVTAETRTQFHVRYISGSDVYIDGGRDAGLADGTKLVFAASGKRLSLIDRDQHILLQHSGVDTFIST